MLLQEDDYPNLVWSRLIMRCIGTSKPYACQLVVKHEFHVESVTEGKERSNTDKDKVYDMPKE